MPRRLFAALGLLAGLVLAAAAADTKDADASKKALQQVGEFVGEWKGNGEAKSGGKTALWKETLSWSWKFKDNGAVFATGTSTTTGPSGSFEVERKPANQAGTDNLVFRAVNPKSGEVCRATVSW